MDINERERLISVVKKYTYEPASESFLDMLEKQMEKLVCSKLSDYTDKEVYAKFLYERKKYNEAIKKFVWISHVKDCKARVSYGLFKCYIMIEDYKSAYKCIVDYIEERKNDNVSAGMEIIISCFDIIFNKNYTNIEEKNRFLMNEIRNQELKEKYSELVENFNKKNFSRCIVLAEECDEICKKKKIKMEFQTFKQLLKEAKKISSINLYDELEQANKDLNFDRLIEILKELPKFNIKNKKLFYNSLYLLAKNGYYKEVHDILLGLYITSEDKIFINILKRTIANQIGYENLSEVEKENYNKALKLGKRYYNVYDIETAYDAYQYGYYTTRNDIFLYYIGKMFFKVGQYKIAKKYFRKYARTGSDKLAKAYLYLASIYKENHENQKALHYSRLVEKLNNLYGTDYEMFYIADYNNPDEDPLKMRLQTNNNMYSGLFEENSEKVLKLGEVKSHIQIK